MSDTSGPTSRTPLAFFDPDESCSRTWMVTDLWGWRTFSETLPRWGMWDGGVLFELPTPALPTVEPASSSLLPTPAVNDMGAGKTPEAWDAWTERMKAAHGNGNGHGPSLSIEALRLLPTPVADHSRGLAQPGSDFQSLPNVALSLLPTPGATDGTKGGPNQRGSSGDMMLPSAVIQMLPTPTSRDWKGQNQRRDISCLPGALMPPPSTAGSESSDAQPLDQLSLDEPESA